MPANLGTHPLGAEWRALQREAQLAAAQVAHGATMLGRADHTQTGLYAAAFFGLAIGLERMGKLVFLADYAIRSGGAYPTNGDLTKIGHNLTSLLDKCESVGAELTADWEYKARPCDVIHNGIENVLSLFATKLRYYNLNHLTGAGDSKHDPIGLWWEKVAAPICERHYSQRQRQKDEAFSVAAEKIFGDNSIVLHTAEAGEAILDVGTFFAHGRATGVVQKYGQLYTLQIVRWLASMLYELSHRGAYEQRIEALLGLHEPFIMFLNEDRYLRNRRTWPVS